MPEQQLLEIIQDIAAGKYSNDIMALTGEDTPEPVRTIAEAMGMMMVKVEAREYRLEMMIDELKDLNRQIKNNTIATVSTMANALAARDTYTEGHAERVADYGGKIAEVMGLDDEAVEYVRLGGLLHDIGKIGFPDELFTPHQKKNPPGMVKKIVSHPTVGATILKNLDFLGPALEYVHCHHERPDGKGYPRHLTVDDIPLGARILAVADAFDAITTDRPYQKGRSVDEALEILREGAGQAWDQPCVEAFAKVLETEKSNSLKPPGSGKSSFDLIDAERFFHLLALQKGSVVADLACGHGAYTVALSRLVGDKGHVFGVDLWQNGIILVDHLIQRDGLANVTTLRADICKNIPIESKRVDLCLMATALHDLTPPDAAVGALRECARILRKKGRLAIVEFQKIDPPPGPPTAIRLSPEQVRKQVESHGFKWRRTELLEPYLYLSLFVKSG